MPKLKDLTGQRFGQLVVLKRAESKDPGAKWLCLCDCGVAKVVRGDDLKRGKVLSCGCKRKAGSHRTHNLSDTRLYRIWTNMKTRCYNTNIKQYKDYGGRGIAVCDKWKDSFESFYEWATANDYSEKLTIDRIDVNGNYEPSNCRWITMKEQAKNRTNNHYLTYNGETKTIAEWAEITDIHRSTIESRLKSGLTIEQVLTKAP